MKICFYIASILAVLTLLNVINIPWQAIITVMFLPVLMAVGIIVLLGVAFTVFSLVVSICEYFDKR